LAPHELTLARIDQYVKEEEQKVATPGIFSVFKTAAWVSLLQLTGYDLPNAEGKNVPRNGGEMLYHRFLYGKIKSLIVNRRAFAIRDRSSASINTRRTFRLCIFLITIEILIVLGSLILALY
jgi:hypothetical protein